MMKTYRKSTQELSSNSNKVESWKHKYKNKWTTNQTWAKTTIIWRCQKWTTWQWQIVKLQSLFPQCSQLETYWVCFKSLTLTLSNMDGYTTQNNF
jgi:hypothetical protein